MSIPCFRMPRNGAIRALRMALARVGVCPTLRQHLRDVCARIVTGALAPCVISLYKASIIEFQDTIDMSCSYMSDNGIPSLCAVGYVQVLLAGFALPFALYRIWKYRSSTKRDAFLSVFAATCRKLAFCTSASFTVLSASQPSATGVLFTAAALTITILHYTELSLVPRSVASTELLLWWVSETVVCVSRLAAQPVLLNAALSVLASSTWLLETYSSPWDPQGFEDASIFGQINMSFMRKMIETAQERIISSDDFAGCPQGTSMHLAYASFEKKFNSYPQSSKYRLIRSLLAFRKSRILLMLAFDVLGDAVSYSQPLLLSWFLKSLQIGKDTLSVRYESVYLAFAVACALVLSNAFDGLRQNIVSEVYIDFRTSLMDAIYRKALTLTSDSRNEYDTSKIMNLINVDTESLEMVFAQAATIFSAPIGLIYCSVQLYMFMGKATLAAIPFYALYLPFTSWSTRKMLRTFPATMAARDARGKSTISVMRNIKSLKLYAWEEPYEKVVFEDRENELSIRRNFLKLRVALRAVSGQLDNVVLATVFLAFLYFSSTPLTPEIVFPALALIKLVSGPLFTIPTTISELGSAVTSQTRILQFLEQPEEKFENYYRKPAVGQDDFDSPAVELENAQIAWGNDNGAPIAVMPLNLQLRRGDLCCVLGKVGTGKSALLRALCGQLNITSGSITVKGSLAYASQEPWLQYKSIRDNILFGLEYDEEFYKATIESCDLESDTALFPEGDLTEIGERGISLSGGQKARVSLARAIYSRADVYVLDDVLSAVDQHVSNKLLKNLFASDGLLGSKVVILATHTAKSLKMASKLVCMARGGEVIYNGASTNAGAADLLSVTGEDFTLSDIATVLPKDGFDRHEEVKKLNARNRAVMASSLDPENANATFSPQSFTRDEMLPDVPIWGTYKRYLKTAGRITIPTVAIAVAGVLSSCLITLWLTVWSGKGLSGIKESRFYINVFLALMVLNLVADCGGYYAFLGLLALRVSRRLHDMMLDSVVHAPMSFFERTPLGTIMSRFTGDVASLDQTMPLTMYAFLYMVLDTTLNLGISVIGSPLLVVILVPLFFKYNGYRKAFVPASRQVQKLMRASNGPLLSHIEESTRGVSLITAFDMRAQFIKGFESRGNYWAYTSFLRYALRRWMNTRVTLMSASVVALAMLSVVFLVRFANLPVSVAGIVLYGIRTAHSRLSRIIESWTQVEVTVVGVERVFDYIDLQREAPYHIGPLEGAALQKNWPSHGVIEFREYSTKYRPELEDSLHNIDLSVLEREKIGVVGRTGAGKSSLTLAIFRILEASSGKIRIDGVNTSKLGLFDLRSRLSIIPQEAQIFKGTLRQNLDPLNTSDDTKLWRILELCHLKDHFEAGLNTEITEGGENISRGQAQLICLGRALSRPTKILVLDEATASVDTNTDSFVQSMIRREFKDRTIITIAHRLDTVIDSDKILVLDKGRVVEFGSPQELLEQRGAFYELRNSKQ